MHFESASGGGLSDALGLAGYTNLDVVRNPTLGSTPYIARGMIRQIIPLSGERIEEERNPWYLATEVPVRRLELRFGKMGTNDFFDINEAGSDSHSQFMRAAFKAISDNKQAAVLAPTTVLAFQHFETFKQRFAAFPVTIEMISRFRSPKQQKEILQKVEEGKIDVLIGTHRILSKDIKFSDLGLLIVDEEQRFGVRHKERLKQMRKQVDVLTMRSRRTLKPNSLPGWARGEPAHTAI